MIQGNYQEGYFEFFVDCNGDVQFIMLNGIIIEPEDADLGKLVDAYFRKKQRLEERIFDFGED